MFFPCEPKTIEGSNEVDVEIPVTHPAVLGRLFIPCMIGVDFYVCGAVLKRKEGEEVVLQPPGKVHGTLFSETSFGVSASGKRVRPGDVITLKVCLITPAKEIVGWRRQFSAAWDASTEGAEQ